MSSGTERGGLEQDQWVVGERGKQVKPRWNGNWKEEVEVEVVKTREWRRGEVTVKNRDAVFYSSACFTKELTEECRCMYNF